MNRLFAVWIRRQIWAVFNIRFLQKWAGRPQERTLKRPDSAPSGDPSAGVLDGDGWRIVLEEQGLGYKVTDSNGRNVPVYRRGPGSTLVREYDRSDVGEGGPVIPAESRD